MNTLSRHDTCSKLGNCRWPLCSLLMLLVLSCGCRRTDDAPPATETSAAALEQTTTPTGIDMVRVPAGRCTLGSSDGEADEQPVDVELSSFWIDRTEVTQAAFEKLMGRNTSKWKGPQRPVERVSWPSAAKYCNARSLKEGLQPCYDPDTLACDFDANGYRLPTEAEWEYACRGETTGDYSFGNDAGKLRQCAWYQDNSVKTTHPVGEKQPNPWGLSDMHGNVWEWCNDFYSEQYGPASSGKDPRGPTAGEERVLRGGSWRDTAERCRAAARHSETPGFADVCFGYEAYGFRCVRTSAVPF
jgi:formylglycine-generating enzyme required for sulfatase activity